MHVVALVATTQNLSLFTLLGSAQGTPLVTHEGQAACKLSAAPHDGSVQTRTMPMERSSAQPLAKVAALLCNRRSFVHSLHALHFFHVHFVDQS